MKNNSLVQDGFKVLTLSLRATERIPTSDGAKLDEIKTFESAASKLWESIKESTDWVSFDKRCSDSIEKDGAKFTSIMRSSITSMFGERYLWKSTYPTIVKLNMEGEFGDFVVDHVLACRSGAEDAGKVEGDDILFVLYLKPSSESSTSSVLLTKRLASTTEFFSFMASLNMLKNDHELFSTSQIQPGFYLIHSHRIADSQKDKYCDVAEWLSAVEGAKQATSLVCAYLFYCWLIFQRTERRALSIDVNGDWDIESRKLILARKQLVTGRKYALLKNRAEPDSPILPIFWGVSDIYRINEQIENLAELNDELSKTLETQNGYVSSLRLKTIEIIIFSSTVLGLGVALNAIQMPPFYDSSSGNALARPVFWTVLVGIVVLAVFSWWLLMRGRKFFKVLITKLGL